MLAQGHAQPFGLDGFGMNLFFWQGEGGGPGGIVLEQREQGGQVRVTGKLAGFGIGAPFFKNAPVGLTNAC